MYARLPPFQRNEFSLIHLFLFVLKVKLQYNLKIFINQVKVPAN
ncbi:hypothetical protein WN943_018928 [Citrus x changshan-huyou]